jgi:tRNA (guanine37-N1)-methyltransferase
MKIDVLTLFPEMFSGVLNASILSRASRAGLLNISLHNIRDYSRDKHRKTDDYPFGGGAGLVLSPQPLFDAIQSVLGQDAPPLGDTEPLPGFQTAPDVHPEGSTTRRIYLSPRGRLLDKDGIDALAKSEGLLLLCGHYEGLDQRVLDHFAFEELSIGDYILTGGELPAMVLIDAVARMLPGVLGNVEAHQEESVYSGLLEYPQYTRPAEYEGLTVPPVLISGHHEAIRLWNYEQSLKLTAKVRPDLLQAYLKKHRGNKGTPPLSKAEYKILSAYL